jgi:hypothetical protein
MEAEDQLRAEKRAAARRRLFGAADVKSERELETRVAAAVEKRVDFEITMARRLSAHEPAPGKCHREDPD